MLLRGLLSMVLFVTIDLSHSKIVIRPSNSETSVGDQVHLHCAIDDAGANFTVEWQHVPVGSTSSVTVNRDKIITSPCGSRCAVEGNRESGEYNLIIRNATLADAGKYTCVDIRDSSRADVQLIVFDSYPSPQFCTVAAAVDGIVGLNSCGIQPDAVHLSCLMSFRGSWKPTMDWSSTSSAGHHALTLGEKLLSNFTMNADEITDDDNFTCYVKYPDGEATSRFRWTLSLDVFSNRTRLVEVNGSQPRKIDCAVKTPHICRYSWTFKDINGERVSSESTLDLNDLQSGVYVCSTECTIRGTTCTVEPVKVSYMLIMGHRTPSGAIAAFAVVPVVVISVCLITVVCFYQRKRIQQLNEETKEQPRNFTVALPEDDDKIEGGPIKSEDVLVASEEKETAGEKPHFLVEETKECLPGDLYTNEIKPSTDDETANIQKEESVQSIANSDSDVDTSEYVLVKLNEDSIEERVEYPLVRMLSAYLSINSGGGGGGGGLLIRAISDWSSVALVRSSSATEIFKMKNKRTWTPSEENLLSLLIHFGIVLLYVQLQMTYFASASTVSPPSDCGWPSIEEITCDYYGCCWKSTNSSTIGCFNATNDTTTTTLLPTTTTLLPTTTTVTTTTTLQTTTTVVATTTAPTTMASTSTVQTTGPGTTITQQDSSTAIEVTSQALYFTGMTAKETTASNTDATSQTTAIPATTVAAGDTAATTTIDEQLTTSGPADSTTASFTAACVPEWNNFTDRFLLQGALYSEFSASTDDCLRGCSDLIVNCVAANVFLSENNSVLCFLHSNINDLANIFSSNQANLYQLQKRCIYHRTTVAAESLATTSADCTAAAWLNTTGTCFNGALPFLEYKSVDDCLTACSCYVSGCIAAFVRNATDGTVQCYMNKRSDSLADLWSCPSVTQYVVLGSQDLSSAVSYSLYPVTTELIPTTETLVDYAICWHPPEAQKTDVVLYKDAYGLVAIYTCRQGYSFAYGGTSRTSVCQGNQWINKVPGCEPVICDTSGFSADQTYALSPNSLHSGQVLSRSCSAKNDRFIDGCVHETIKCTTASGRLGLLQKQPSSCKGGRCFAPPLITNTTALYNGFERLLLLTCIPGHRFPDGKSQQSSTCNKDGSWPLISPCQAIFCPVLPPLANGSYGTDQVIYGTTVTARCKTGFMFPDHNLTRTFKCINGAGLDAEWDDQRADKCQVATCTNPPTPVTGECTWSLSTPTTTSTFYYLDSILYDCLGGRKFSDGYKSKRVYCKANGFWSADEVSCDYNRCDPVPGVGQATPSTLKAVKGSVVDFTCDLGYWFQRNKTVESSTCDGISWSTVDAQCTEVTCPELTKTVTNAIINSTDNAYDAVIEVECLPGYLFNDQQTIAINCTVTGDWSTNITCQPVDCGPTESVMNAIVTLSLTSTTFGSNVTYECIDGFWFGRNTSSMTATCDVTAQWSVNAVAGVAHWRHCNPITCLPLVTSHVVNTTDVAIETVVNVSCQDGQRFATSKANNIEAACSDIGIWQPAIPDCINKDPTQKVKLQVTEAKQSDVIAGVAIAVVVVAVVILVFFDWSRLRTALTLLAKNANTSFGR